MKITLSKSQWQAIGKKAGWMKKASDALTITLYVWKEQENIGDGQIQTYNHYSARPKEGYEPVKVSVEGQYERPSESNSEPSFNGGWGIGSITNDETGEKIDYKSIENREHIDDLLTSASSPY